MNRKRGVWGLIAVLVLLSLVSAQQVLANGVTVGTQTELLKYEVFITKFEVFYVGGSDWVIVFEEPSEKVDMALGALAGTFFSEQSLAAGTVNKIRVTVDQQMTIKGKVKVGETTYYTVTDYVNEDTTNINNYDEQTYSTGEDFIKTLDINMVVGAGQTATLKITFNVRNEDNAITCYAIPLPWVYMVIGQEVNVTVAIVP